MTKIMPMRDYEDLKNLKITAEQERIMDIICDAWEECRATDCQSECKDNQVLPCERPLFACTALKYSRKIHEAGYIPAKWIDVNDHLPETADDVLVVLAHTYEDDYREYSIARYIPFDDGSHWADSKHGYLEWDRYTDGHGGSSLYKVIAWMTIPTYHGCRFQRIRRKKMAEWIDVRERLPENSGRWENYIVAVIHANPLYFIGNTFVVPALYNSQQKMWIILWGPGESEHLNALISPEKSQPDEHCVAYWMNMPELPELEK